MIVVADRGASAYEADLSPGAGAPDFAMLSNALRQKLGHPVMVASLGPDWTLKSAGVARISGIRASQLVFARGDETASVLSFPGASFYATQEGSEYAQMQAGRPIAGFVYKGAVHCVVVGAEMSLKEATKLRDKLRNTLKVSSGTSGCAAPAESMARAST